MKKILLILLLLPFTGFFNVAACSINSQGDDWFSFKEVIFNNQQNLPEGVNIFLGDGEHFLQNDSATPFLIYKQYSDIPQSLRDQYVGNTLEVEYKLENSKVYYYNSFTGDSNLELTDIIKDAVGAGRTDAGRRVGDNRPADVKVPMAETFQIKYSSNGINGSISGRVIYELNPDYDPQAFAKAAAGCNSLDILGMISTPIGLVIICCVAPILLIVTYLVVRKLRQKRS